MKKNHNRDNYFGNHVNHSKNGGIKIIRNCQITDSPAIQRLNKKELGYNYPLDQTTKNLANILNDPQHHWLLVFVDDKGQDIKGYVHAELYATTYLAPMFNILALAVDSSFQKKGIGRQLMQTIEKTAQSLGIKEIRLNSSTSRANTHQFYENIDYTVIKFRKDLEKS